MSQNKHYRQRWIEVVYAEAVDTFHNARKANEDDVPLADLARASANTAFSNHAHQIIGDKEEVAKAFMAHCRENFQTEIEKAIAAQARADIETAQFEPVGIN